MGNRLSKIVTRTGDNGTTGLADGSRVPKDASIIEAIGDVDELNSFIGSVLLDANKTELVTQLKSIQQQLFNCGGDLCLPGSLLVNHLSIEELENQISVITELLPPLTNFILPGGNRLSTKMHLARSVARRAERRCVSARAENEFNQLVLVYLNRLSDWLFAMARYCDDSDETLWNQD